MVLLPRSTRRFVASFGLTALALAPAQAQTLTGTYDNNPLYGLSLQGGRYIVRNPADFSGNGVSQDVVLGSGLLGRGTQLWTYGGTFNNNFVAGAKLVANSQLVANGGDYSYNDLGILLDSATATINACNVDSNRTGGLFLKNQSRATVNGGVFSRNGLSLSPPEDTPISGGVYASNAASLLVHGGSFLLNESGLFAIASGNLTVTDGFFSGNSNGIFSRETPTLITGGTFQSNNRGAWICGGSGVITGGAFADGAFGVVVTPAFIPNTNILMPGSLRIQGGTFTGNGAGASTQELATLVIDKGTFSHNAVGIENAHGVLAINGGTFTSNGIDSIRDTIANFPYGDYPTGGAYVIGGGQSVIRNGNFNNNFPFGLQAWNAGTSVTIIGGDFTNNPSQLGGGVQAGFGASATLNGGDFSSNYIGAVAGMPMADPNIPEAPAGALIINGGTFHNQRACALAQNGSTITVTGGDFSSDVIGLNAQGGSVIKVKGGSYQAGVVTLLTSGIDSTIQLYGAFDGYDLSHGPVTIDSIVNGFSRTLRGTLHGKLQNCAAAQDFSYQIGAFGHLVLNPPQP